MSMDLYIDTDIPLAKDIYLSGCFCAMVEYASLEDSELKQLENLLGLDLRPLYTATHPEDPSKDNYWQPLDSLLDCLKQLLSSLEKQPDLIPSVKLLAEFSDDYVEYFAKNLFQKEMEFFLDYLNGAKTAGVQKILITAD